VEELHKVTVYSFSFKAPIKGRKGTSKYSILHNINYRTNIYFCLYTNIIENCVINYIFLSFIVIAFREFISINYFHNPYFDSIFEQLGCQYL